jgi:RNase P/RNase MRP subunit p30
MFLCESTTKSARETVNLAEKYRNPVVLNLKTQTEHEMRNPSKNR